MNLSFVCYQTKQSERRRDTIDCERGRELTGGSLLQGIDSKDTAATLTLTLGHLKLLLLVAAAAAATRSHARTHTQLGVAVRTAPNGEGRGGGDTYTSEPHTRSPSFYPMLLFILDSLPPPPPPPFKRQQNDTPTMRR